MNNIFKLATHLVFTASLTVALSYPVWIYADVHRIVGGVGGELFFSIMLAVEAWYTSKLLLGKYEEEMNPRKKSKKHRRTWKVYDLKGEAR